MKRQPSFLVELAIALAILVVAGFIRSYLYGVLASIFGYTY